ncbi:MAG: DUF2335 domain-containing protein [Myxococcota bacterium]|nr:DUF2335 domain-containing protein [Myxococcota bacterium]
MSPTLPPQVLAKYQEIVPDAGERFLRYMEREQDHRHGNQRIVLRQISKTQTFTFTLAFLALAGGFTSILLGQSMGLVAVLAGALPFLQAVYERHKQEKLERKQQEQIGAGPPG